VEQPEQDPPWTPTPAEEALVRRWFDDDATLRRYWRWSERLIGVAVLLAFLSAFFTLTALLAMVTALTKGEPPLLVMQMAMLAVGLFVCSLGLAIASRLIERRADRLKQDLLTRSW
jgi:polyferredoxin